MATETVADLGNNSIYQKDQAGEHMLDLAVEVRAPNDASTPEAQSDTIWEHLLAEQRSAAKSNIHVYLDEFISVVQGGLTQMRQMLLHFFPQIDRVFCTNEEADTNRKYPIFLKKM